MAAAATMSEDRFWTLIDEARARAGAGADRHERQLHELTEALAALPAAEIAAFDAR